MEWTSENIDKLIGSADYSLETGLKKTLIAKIRPVREISLDELKDKMGRSAGDMKPRGRGHERHAPSHGMEKDTAMNNDRAMVPGGRRQ